jgi:hypothetical protein
MLDHCHSLIYVISIMFFIATGYVKYERCNRAVGKQSTAQDVASRLCAFPSAKSSEVVGVVPVVGPFVLVSVFSICCAHPVNLVATFRVASFARMLATGNVTTLPLPQSVAPIAAIATVKASASLGEIFDLSGTESTGWMRSHRWRLCFDPGSVLT